MNAADNRVQPVRYEATPAYNRALEQPPNEIQHTWSKPFPWINESFTFTIADYSNVGEWPEIYFDPSELIQPINLDTIMLWCWDSNYRFTGCDPNKTWADLGFEMVCTVSKIYVRDINDHLVYTYDNDAPGFIDHVLSLNTKPSHTVTDQLELRVRNEELNYRLSLNGASKISGSAITQHSLPASMKFVYGVGEPPQIRSDLSRGNCWRMKALYTRNDL